MSITFRHSKPRWYDLISVILHELGQVIPSFQAARRADRLLFNHLGEPAFRKMIRTGWLIVESRSHPGRQYHIPWEKGCLVSVRQRREEFFLCVMPAERLPHSAKILMHMLMIEGDEETYLKAANRVE